MIPTITLGDNLTVSKLGFGGMAVTDTYGSTPDEVAKQAIHIALDAGITFIDTADVYGEPRPNTTGPAGTNEELIGEVLTTTGLKRDEIQLATKFGIVGFDLENGMSVRGDREYVREACHNSLRRLGVDHIDLYYMHRRELTRPIEETVTAMAELVAEGKVRHIGLSEVTADELRAAHRIHHHRGTKRMEHLVPRRRTPRGARCQRTRRRLRPLLPTGARLPHRNPPKRSCAIIHSCGAAPLRPALR